ncbi:uncharacterized protein LOC143910880 [Arctopsyche grandis]|uniref:uncharacterized protein LOC143910880 n=1 Tax=Arctopsyche grandis TaxID=121162 RepID=UPI00406D6AD2
MWCKTSIALTIVVVWCAVVTLAMAAPLESDMSRPARPSSFDNVDEFMEYVNKLKEYYRPKTGGRFGKRSYEIPAIWRNYFMLQNRMY